VLTAKDAIKTAGLDWKVELVKLFAEYEGQMVEVPDRLGVQRDEDGKILGTVGTHYVPFNNSQAFEFMDNLVDSGDAKYETAGSLRGGKIVFLTLKIPRDILIGGEDKHEIYLLLRTSHDGTKAISVYVTPIRVVCMNTLSLATYGQNVKQKWSVTHVSTVHGRLAEARDALQMTFKYADEFESLGNRLLSTRIADSDLSKVLDYILPDRPKTYEVKGQITQLYKSSSTVTPYHGTAWGALQAITEYYDWYRRTSSVEAKFISTIDGVGAKARNAATSLLLTL
jgi:phage/plasmid-like protein (TIGR03299 family)